MRVVDGPVSKAVETDITYGEISDKSVECFQASLSELYTPILETQVRVPPDVAFRGVI